MLDQDRWLKAKKLFAEAITLEEDQRAAFLKKACAGDSELLDELQSLLAAHQKEGPVDHALPGLREAFEAHFGEESVEGRSVGSYELIRLLSHSGMGRVYLARRADGQFDSRVALKLLGTSLASDETIQRFLAERQILASFNHPNIARLLDGGVTNEGHPYIVMEYVDGQPLDEYCRANALTLRQRLELFLSVCEAVQYAHSSLVIHRDLKPSNIFVTEDGTVKLLDFGIAKLLNPETVRASNAPLTRTGLLPMTPAYASPEQVQGKAITTASDVYQLGVVLYELLTGRRPYLIRGHTPSEVERIICEQEPPRPSTTITRQSPVHSEEVGRQVDPVEIRKKLRGDLDTIIMKALRKEPDRRYETAKQLAEDIRRHCEGRPVAAHPDSVTYRIGKFIHRHKWGVAFTAVVTMLLVGYAGTITWHSQQTQAALEQSEREAAKSEQVTSFLVSMFEQTDPYSPQGMGTRFSDTLTTFELLEQGAARVQYELFAQPEVQARMMYTLGRIYRHLGRYEEASPLLEEAVTIQRTHLDPQHPDLARSLHELGRLLRHRGELTRPERLYREALDIQYEHLGEQHPDIAENLNELAIIAARSGDFALADSLFQEAEGMLTSLHGADHPDVANTITRRGILHMLREEHTEAEELFRISLDILRNNLTSNHPHVASTMDRLGQVLLVQGAVDESEPFLREAMTIRQKRFEGDHPELAVSLTNIGQLLHKRGDYGAADGYLAQAQEIYQRMYGAQNMDAAAVIFKRGQLYERSGDYATAESLYLEAVNMQEALHGVDNHYTRKYIDTLIALYDHRNQPAKADSLHVLVAQSGQP